MLIRKANPDEYNQILRLMRHGIYEWGSEIWEDLADWVDSTCTPERLQSIQENGCLLVAIDEETNNLITGTAHGYPHKTEPDVWILGGIYVVLKNAGIGSNLAQTILGHGSALGYMNAHSYVYEHNSGSLKFLERHGALEVDDEVTAGNLYLTLSIPLGSQPSG